MIFILDSLLLIAFLIRCLRDPIGGDESGGGEEGKGQKSEGGLQKVLKIAHVGDPEQHLADDGFISNGVVGGTVEIALRGDPSLTCLVGLHVDDAVGDAIGIALIDDDIVHLILCLPMNDDDIVSGNGILHTARNDNGTAEAEDERALLAGDLALNEAGGVEDSDEDQNARQHKTGDFENTFHGRIFSPSGCFASDISPTRIRGHIPWETGQESKPARRVAGFEFLKHKIVVDMWWG